MQNFDIVKKSDIEKTFRVARIMSDFDVQFSHTDEHFQGQIDLPDQWNIGLIVGKSGTGKSTIAKEIFKKELWQGGEYTAKSVVDDMPKNATIDDIEKMFYMVGFGSVPCWLKPYKVLSTGEKMRVEIANAFLRDDFVVFDEFTSVVDRQVAEVISFTIRKRIESLNKKFVAVSCHRDIIPWLQPDWIFDTDIMQMVFLKAHDRNENLKFENVGAKNGKSLGVITI